MPRKINVVSPAGRILAVPADKVRDFLFLGYRVEEAGEAVARVKQDAEREYYDTPGQQVLAGVEGALSGATLGLSDAALSAMGNPVGERAAYHPGTRLVTELGGAIIPALLSGGSTAPASLAGRFARLTPAGALSSAAVRAGGPGFRGALVAGAIEGGVGGVGGAVSHAALSGEPLTSEAVLAGLRLGTAFGLGAGAIGHGIEVGGLKLRDKLARQNSVEDEVFSIASGGSGRSPEVRPQPLPREVAPNPYPGATSALDARRMASEALLPQEKYAAFRVAIADLRAAANDAAAKVDEAELAVTRAVTGKGGNAHTGMADMYRRQWEAARQVGDRVYSEALGAADPRVKEAVRAMQKARGQVQVVMRSRPDELGAALEGYRGAIQNLAGRVQGLPPGVRLSLDFGTATGEPAQQFVKSVEEITRLKAALDDLEMPDPGGFFGHEEVRVEKLLGQLDLALKSRVPEVAPQQAALEEAIKDAVAGAGVTAEGSTIDQLRALHAAGRGARETAAKRWVAWKSDVDAPREVPPPTTPTPEPGPTQPREKVEKPDKVSPWAAGVNALIRRAAYAAGGAMFGQAVGGGTWAGALVGALLTARGGALGAIEAAAAKVGPGFGRAVRRAGPLGYGLARSLSGRQDPEGALRDQFAARSQELRQVLVVGRDRAFLTAQELSAAGHPDLAKGWYDTATRALGVLDKRLPRDPPGTRWGSQYIYEAPEEVLVRFSQEWQAVTAPLDFLSGAMDAPTDVFPEAVAALREAYPALYGEFRARVLDGLATTGTAQYSMEDLGALSTLLSFPLIPTASTDFIVAQAAMFAEPPPEPPQGGPKMPPGRPPGANPEATRTQQRTL